MKKICTQQLKQQMGSKMTIEYYLQKLDAILELDKNRVPMDYEARCKEFSNIAPLEIWTEYGWYKELPHDYRNPTTYFIVAATNNLAKIIETQKRLISNCQNAIAAMKYAYEDHADQYYLNVKSDLEKTLAEICRGDE